MGSISFHQISDKLLFAGMAGGKCVTTACNDRNTIGGCSVSLPRSDCCLTHQPKPPLCKGRWQKSSIFAGGVVADQSYHYVGIYANSKLFPHNPSVKNQRFLTAPFTQGSLGRSRASASSSGLYRVTMPSTPQWCYDYCKPS